MTEIKGSDNSESQKKRLLAERYEEFEDTIDKLGVFNFKTPQDYLRHPCFLGGNKYQAAFVFAPDDQSAKYVVRTPNLVDQNRNAEGIALRLSAFNKRRDALILGMGIRGLEQIVALSNKHQAIVTRFAQGHLTSDLTYDDFYAVPRMHWLDLWANVKEASEHGIAVDGHMSNVIYDSGSGFTILDYETADTTSSHQELFEINITELSQLKSWSALSSDEKQ